MKNKIQTVKDIPDEKEFKLSDRSKVSYILNRKEKREAVITSTASGRTYRVSLKREAYNI